ncbi:hypothetical protein [Smaragdicoccus niigatensis]|uniref:hypothetical protein n=1 Tax=Smaragdicoccus niigatensis TaxID=359359 RepID=UPI00035C9D33|nr:hypothetical protein [Smaragdicoccus niigatensis]
MSSSATVFQVDDDGLDNAAFLDAVRRVVVDHAASDSVVTIALIRHIDHLLRMDGITTGDKIIAERREQFETALRSVLSHVDFPTGPNTVQFKAVIDKGKKK